MIEKYIFSRLIGITTVNKIIFSSKEIKLVFEALSYLQARHYDYKKREKFRQIVRKLNKLKWRSKNDLQ